MSTDSRRTIAVLGATGAQGGAVVRALQTHGTFRVRALTRNPDAAVGLADEVVAADLTEPDTLAAAFDGVYGVFANTNSFASHDTDEVAQGVAAAKAARAAGVKHYVWSTLPNVAEIADGRYTVPHFSNKAAVNAEVAGQGFDLFTFVEPPFYFQNLISPMYTKNPGPDGTPTWAILMEPDARGMHMGDIDEYGNLVAGVFAHPEITGQGQYLSFAGDLLSWDDIVATLRSQGHSIAVERTTDDPWHTGDMFGYFAEYTYFGPDAEEKIQAANEVATEPFTNFAKWATENMPA
jgi:uncharacterized protein YbjT (DUF2867 family)